MITSLANPKVKYARSLSRRRVRYRERAFCIEGFRLVKDAWEAGIVPAFVFYAAGEEGAPWRDLIAAMAERGVPCYEASSTVIEALSDTVTPQGIVAVVPMPEASSCPSGDLHLVLDRVQDPGNLGAILRVAAAVGVDHVWIAPGTVDPFNPKAVRSAMGAHFRVTMTVASWEEIGVALRGMDVWVADSRGDRLYDAVDWTRPAALVLGGEAHGASQEAMRLCAGTIAIPMANQVESLNAAVAAGVILYEAARQRRARAAGL